MAFILRTRVNDDAEWGEPEVFATRRQRDKAASFARIIGGLRTHSFETSKNECAHGHTTRVVGCVSCVLVFDRERRTDAIS